MGILKNRFKDKVMIITGAASGIGKATALRAAKEGAKVVLVDIAKERVENVAQLIISEGGQAIFNVVNLSNEEEVKNLVGSAVKEFGKVDIMINIAGVMMSPTPVHLLEKKDMDYMFENNFYSVYFCCKYCIKQFIKQNHGGSIVNTSSISGMNGMPGTPAYVACKHAINGLTKNMAIDYAQYGIRVNSVNPAPTSTPMAERGFAEAKKKMAASIKAGADISKDMPFLKKNANLQNRSAQPEEQAASILFLASDEASHMTGAIVATDGGWTAF